MPEIAIVAIALVVIAAIAGWVLTEFIKAKSGYPIEGSDGTPLLPGKGKSEENVRMLTDENERLREQLTAVHDRLETLERIVTDKPSRLEQEIDALRTITRVEKSREDSNI